MLSINKGEDVMKRISIIILCFIFLFTFSSYAISFNDLSSNHWAYEPITKLAEDNVINGFPDGSYKPDSTITNGEFIKLVMTASFEPGFYFGAPSEEFNHWAAPYIFVAESYGVLEPGEINKDNVDKPIKRIEMVKIISMADMILLENNFDNSKELQFTDIFSVVGIERTLLQHAFSRDLVKGNPNGTFNPDGNMLRSEAAMMIYRYSY
jgi:hypothetical protein